MILALRSSIPDGVDGAKDDGGDVNVDDARGKATLTRGRVHVAYQGRTRLGVAALMVRTLGHGREQRAVAAVLYSVIDGVGEGKESQ